MINCGGGMGTVGIYEKPSQDDKLSQIIVNGYIAKNFSVHKIW